MATEQICFKDYVKIIDDKTLSKTRKKMNKKTPSNRVYGLDHSGGIPMVGESILCELLAGNSSAYTASILATVPNQKEEEEESTPQQRNRAASASTGGNRTGNKIDGARQLFQALINRPDSTRKAIIQAFEEKINVTHSTAVSYYERLAKEAGITGSDSDDSFGDGNDNVENEMTAGGPVSELPADTELEIDDDLEMDDEERIGVIRTVKNAHLIYKQQTETGSFEELWIYNINKENDEMDVKRDILAGTDIPPKKTKSPDGSQSFTVTTLGNAQYIHLKGLPN